MLKSMTLRDICSHWTGILGLEEIIQGMNEGILLPKSEVFYVVNALPRRFGFWTEFHYNNALFELAGAIMNRFLDPRPGETFSRKSFSNHWR